MKKDEIKKTALNMFALKGYSGCSLQEIADAVGIAKAALYHYFTSKLELFTVILMEESVQFQDNVQNTIAQYAEEPIEKVLFEIVKGIVFHPTRNSLLLWKKAILMSLSDVDDELRNEVRKIFSKENQEVGVAIRAFLSQKTKTTPDKIRKFYNAYFLFIQTAVDWMLIIHYYQTDDPNMALEEIWDSFWNGNKIE